MQGHCASQVRRFKGNAGNTFSEMAFQRLGQRLRLKAVNHQQQIKIGLHLGAKQHVGRIA